MRNGLLHPLDNVTQLRLFFVESLLISSLYASKYFASPSQISLHNPRLALDVPESFTGRDMSKVLLIVKLLHAVQLLPLNRLQSVCMVIQLRLELCLSFANILVIAKVAY